MTKNFCNKETNARYIKEKQLVKFYKSNSKTVL